MAIRINLLAEAQAAEDLRRRDPVKRATWIGALLIAGVLAWASLLQARIALKKAEANRIEGRIAELQANYSEIVETQKSLKAAQQKLAALDKLTASRYLSGNLLDALQHAYVPDVQMMKLRTRFDYILEAETKARTNGVKITRAKPATSTEKITVQIEAVDSSSNAGDKVNPYKETIASLDHINEMFQNEEHEVRLTGLNPPTAEGRVLFTLECAYPEVVR